MASRIFLGVDTATPHLSLSLWADDKGNLGGSAPRVDRAHAERVLPELATLFNSAGCDKSELAGIGVGTGPGSYTGLRVGIATAKGLADGLSIPLIGLSSLAAIAYSALSDGETGLITLDARRGKVYAAVYKKQAGKLETLRPPFKGERGKLQGQYSHVSYVEDAPPDASYLARACAEGFGAEVAPLYL